MLIEEAFSDGSNVSGPFTWSNQEVIVVGPCSDQTDIVFQVRATEGSHVWTDTSLTATLSTTENTEVVGDYSVLETRDKMSVRARSTVASAYVISTEPAIVEPVLGPDINATRPRLRIPRRFQRVEFPIISNSALGDLAAGSIVLIGNGGQSNWNATGQGALNDYSGPYPSNAFIWNGTDFSTAMSSNFHGGRGSSAVFFALEFERQYPDLVLYIIDEGTGATGFQNGTGGFAVGGQPRMDITMAMTGGFAFLNTNDVNFYWLGYGWNQGEQDAAVADNANAYQSQLQGFRDELETIIGSTSRFTAVRLHEDWRNGASEVNAPTVRAAQTAVSDAVVIADSIDLGADNIHYLPDGHQFIGERFLEIFQGYELTEFNPADPVDPPVDPPAGNTTNFQGLSALPAGWTTGPQGVVTFEPEAVRLDSGDGGGAYGFAYVQSPVVDINTSISIEFSTPTGNFASVTIGDDPDWFTTKDNEVVTGNTSLTNGTIKMYGGGRGGGRPTSVGGGFGATDRIRATFTFNGGDVTSVYYNVTTDTELINYTEAISPVGPRIYLEVVGSTEMLIYSYSEV